MCDDDAKRAGRYRLSALPEDTSDESLNADAAREKADEKLLALLNEDRATMRKEEIEKQGKSFLDNSIKFHVDQTYSELHDPLDKADELVIESMLEPLDLPNEYRKICIIMLLTAMFIVM